MILSAEDVRDFHFEVIDDIHEMKNPGAIRSADGHVGSDFDVAKIERDLPADQIIDVHQLTMESETPGAAVLHIKMAGGLKFIEVALVDAFALALEIRAAVASDLRAFVPVEPEPTQSVVDDPQPELAAVVPCEEPVEECRPGSTDVKVAGGRGGKTDTDGSAHMGCGRWRIRPQLGKRKSLGALFGRHARGGTSRGAAIPDQISTTGPGRQNLLVNIRNNASGV